MTFNTLADFYPYYLQEHRNATCRLCHLAGSATVIGILLFLAFTGSWSYIWVCLLAGYGPAWVGHFFFENNRPATFKHPLYSFVSDWIMVKDMLTGKIPLFEDLPLVELQMPEA